MNRVSVIPAQKSFNKTVKMLNVDTSMHLDEKKNYKIEYDGSYHLARYVESHLILLHHIESQGEMTSNLSQSMLSHVKKHLIQNSSILDVTYDFPGTYFTLSYKIEIMDAAQDKTKAKITPELKYTELSPSAGHWPTASAVESIISLSIRM